MPWLGIGLRWVFRIASIFFGLTVALMHAYNLPILNWLWDIKIFQVFPSLLVIAAFFFLSWIWPGGK